jgi:hypothetical protein
MDSYAGGLEHKHGESKIFWVGKELGDWQRNEFIEKKHYFTRNNLWWSAQGEYAQ